MHAADLDTGALQLRQAPARRAVGAARWVVERPNGRIERRLAVLAVATALLALAPRAEGQQIRRLTVADAVAQAVQGSEEVQVAEAGVLRARGDRFQARSGFFPKLSGTAGYGRTLASEFSALRGAPTDSGGSNPFEGLELPFGQKNRYEVGLQGTQTLFAGGQVVAQSRVAEAGVRSAELGVAAERAQQELSVTRAYWDAALADRLVTIAEASLAQADATLRQVHASHGVGQSAEFEVLRAQVARDNQRPQLIQRRADRELALMRLKQLLNVPLADSLELTTQLPTRAELIAMKCGGSDVVALNDVVTPTTADTATAERVTVRQAAELVTVREQLARVVVAQRLPSLALTTQWGRVGYPGNANLPSWSSMRSNWTVGLQVQLPVLTGGAQRGAELKAQADVHEARARLQQTRELAALDARQALERLETALASWDASAGTVEQAERAYRIAEIRYAEGLSTQIELADARLMLQQAEVNRAVAARDVEVARTVVRLLPALPLGR